MEEKKTHVSEETTLQEENEMEKMIDDELEKVSGGFVETGDLPTKGMEIVCPACGNDKYIVRGAYHDKKVDSVEYHCSKHGSFVCYDGNVSWLADWKKLCAEKGYNY